AVELDAQYNVSATVLRVEDYFERWSVESARVREQLTGHLDVPYGTGDRESLDIFPADHPRAPLVIFMHGGFWRRLGKEYFSFVAEPFVASGATVAILNYPLAPAATLDAIVAATRRAIAWLHAHAAEFNGDPARIVATGHSAGGQLSAMLATTDWESYGLPLDAVRRIGPISGVFELGPLRHTHINAWLHLNESLMARNSPIRLRPAVSTQVVAAVGGAETDEFRRQNRAFATEWSSQGSPTLVIEVPARNHFDILLGLLEPNDVLRTALLELVER
ncbi:MAG: alpha/beta hydrolase, partial [Candidatus Baltobacteraceae bacterium]